MLFSLWPGWLWYEEGNPPASLNPSVVPAGRPGIVCCSWACLPWMSRERGGGSPRCGLDTGFAQPSCPGFDSWGAHMKIDSKLSAKALVDGLSDAAMKTEEIRRKAQDLILAVSGYMRSHNDLTTIQRASEELQSALDDYEGVNRN